MISKIVPAYHAFLNRLFGSLVIKKAYNDIYQKFDESPTWKKICQEVFGQYLGQYSCTRIDHIEDLIKVLDISPMDSVLDLGSGLGGLSTQLAIKSGCKLTGVDISDEAVKRANKYVAFKNMSTKVSFIPNKLPDIPFPNNYFEKIVSIDSVYAVPDKHRLFNECFRTMKPGGQIGFFSIYFVKDFTPTNREEKRALRWRTPQEYDYLLEEVGFEDISILDYTDAHIPIARKWVNLVKENRDQLIKELGKRKYEGVLANQIPVWKLAEEGYIKKGLFIAKKFQ